MKGNIGANFDGTGRVFLVHDPSTRPNGTVGVSRDTFFSGADKMKANNIVSVPRNRFAGDL
jgi:hypothetical protein